MSSIVRTEPLHIQAYKSIKSNLLNNKYPPGEKMTELNLASELGISRGPIREAMRMLLQDGLLVQKGSHTFVFEPNLEDALDLYICRESLESLAARLAAENITEKSGYRLLEIVNKTRTALSEKNREEVVKLNTEFHDLILDLSCNSELLKLIKVLKAKIIYMRNSVIHNYTRNIEFVDEHEEIARFLIKKDADVAEMLMKKHIRNDRDAFYNLLKQKVKETKDDE